MSLRPLATALIMALIAGPAHAELIIDRQDGQSPTVVSDAAIVQALSAPARTTAQMSYEGLPSNLHFDGVPPSASTQPFNHRVDHQGADVAQVIVPQAGLMRGQFIQNQVIQSRRLAAPASVRVFETGSSRPANHDTPVKGWADDVPLELALQQVVPQNWGVAATPSIRSHLPTLVSWSGDRPWVSVLSSMVSTLPVSARVDWDSRQVLLFDSTSPIPSSLAIPGALVIKGEAPAVAPARPVAVHVPAVVNHPAPVMVQPAPVRHAHHQAPVLVQSSPVMAPPVAVSTVPAQVPCCAPVAVAAPTPAQQSWLIDPRLTLRENVEAWTKQAGWNSVVWEAADYEMVAPARFEGNFTSPEGPLASLIQAYAESDQPLKVRLLTQDKVVHVTNRNYIQTVVDPASPRSITPSTFSQ